MNILNRMSNFILGVQAEQPGDQDNLGYQGNENENSFKIQGYNLTTDNINQDAWAAFQAVIGDKKLKISIENNYGVRNTIVNFVKSFLEYQQGLGLDQEARNKITLDVSACNKETKKEIFKLGYIPGQLHEGLVN